MVYFFDRIEIPSKDENISLVHLGMAITQKDRAGISRLFHRLFLVHPEYRQKCKIDSNRRVLVVKRDSIKRMISLILNRCKIPIERKEFVCDFYKIKYKSNIIFEADSLAILYEVFIDYHPIIQFRIHNYKVDLYISDLNIVVECDERDHEFYNKTKELLREKQITQYLKCKWVRYNPRYNVGKVIRQINILKGP